VITVVGVALAEPLILVAGVEVDQVWGALVAGPWSGLAIGPPIALLIPDNTSLHRA